MKMQKVLITGARRYNFKDEETGKEIKGVKLSVLDFNDQENDSDVSGIMPKSITAPIEAFSDFNQCPGYYDIDFQVKLGTKKPALIPTKFTYVAPFKVS